jgi:hypothetical protein
MKSAVILLLNLFLTHFTFAQFFIVSDKDGSVNVRDSASTGSRIIDTLNNGHFIYFLEIEPQTGLWRKIEYTRRSKDRSGYVYYDRLKPVAEYERIPSLHHTESAAAYGRDSIRVIVTQQKFDKTKYRLTRDENKRIAEINGKPYWGTDGELPKWEYKSIVIQVGSRTIKLPETAFENLFEPTIWKTEIYYDRMSDTFYIRSQNSDGAGAYDVIWRVVKGVYTDRDVESED